MTRMRARRQKNHGLQIRPTSDQGKKKKKKDGKYNYTNQNTCPVLISCNAPSFGWQSPFLAHLHPGQTQGVHLIVGVCVLALPVQLPERLGPRAFRIGLPISSKNKKKRTCEG